LPDDANPAEGITSVTNYPLYVVTAAAGGDRSGCVAGFVTQCSIVPTRFMVCISTANHTFEVARHSSALGLHLLGRGDHGTASLFAEYTGDDTDKFAHCRWRLGQTGVPLLEECAAWVEGPVLFQQSLGDHHGFVIEPTAGGGIPSRGLLMLRGGEYLIPAHPSEAT
jgi:flavin reductase (DIM6/NTAB) family NADH-FMN oxidoreductase RutF